MKRRTVSIIVAVLAVGIIGVFAALRIQTKADTMPVMSDSVDVAQDNVVEEPEQETEQASSVTEDEPEQTEETAPVTQEQDDTEQEEIDMVEEEPETEPIDQALTDITALDKTMYATSAVNTRSGPSTEYERVGGLTTNEEVHVIGQSNLTAWYQIDVDGVTQFVSNKYLADTKITVSEPSTDTSNNSGGGSSSNGGGSSNNGSGTINGKSIQDYLESTGGTLGTPSLPSRDYEPGHGGSEYIPLK